MANDEEKAVIKFIWKAPDEEQTIKSVEVIIGQAGDVNNDVFEAGLDGTLVKDDSGLEVYQMNACGSGNFEKCIELSRRTYQFLFRITDDGDNCTTDVSEEHFQTILASGRTVNYVEIEAKNNGQNTTRDENFADISEASPLMTQEKKKRKPKGEGCGCQGKCSIM